MHLLIGRVRPDIVLTRAKIAVFVMGDFWHSCPEHGNSPKINAGWWAAKLASNGQRDLRQRTELEAAGWVVEWVWECENPESAALRVEAIWRTRSGRTPMPVP